MTVVTGIGWVSDSGYGMVKGQIRKAIVPAGSSLPPKTEVFDTPFRNFGRLDHASQVVCCSVGLALRDSGIRQPFDPDALVGIVGGGRCGCTDSDLLYYRDYVESGRTLGRGNYFVYTLPTSPLAEASIHFGLKAATLYVQAPGEGMGQVLDIAARLVKDDEATAMVAGISDGRTACFALVERDSPDIRERVLCPLEVARNAASGLFQDPTPSASVSAGLTPGPVTEGTGTKRNS